MTWTTNCSGPDEGFERYPVMRVDDLVGAIWLPGRWQGPTRRT